MTASPGVRERAAMCETLAATAPSAPTLCEGWTALELAAHLYVRERDPFAGPGIVLPGPPARLTERRMAAAKKKGYDALVAAIRRGPPALWRFVPDGVHLVEYFVHHEDVRRANGEGPRPVEDERETALLRWLQRGAGRLYARSVRVGLDVELPDGTRHQLRSGEPVVTMAAPISEVLLYVHGRKEAARVDFDGPADAVAAVRATTFRV